MSCRRRTAPGQHETSAPAFVPPNLTPGSLAPASRRWIGESSWPPGRASASPSGESRARSHRRDGRCGRGRARESVQVPTSPCHVRTGRCAARTTAWMRLAAACSARTASRQRGSGLDTACRMPRQSGRGVITGCRMGLHRNRGVITGCGTRCRSGRGVNTSCSVRTHGNRGVITGYGRGVSRRQRCQHELQHGNSRRSRCRYRARRGVSGLQWSVSGSLGGPQTAPGEARRAQRAVHGPPRRRRKLQRRVIARSRCHHRRRHGEIA